MAHHTRNLETKRSIPRALRLVLVAVIVTFLALLAPAPALGADEEVAPSEYVEAQAARGRVTFRVYCSACHGKTAQGDGPTAEYLRIPPADLTRLAAENGGVLDRDDIYATIDGRTDVRGHGTSEMPIWGVAFQDPGRSENQEDAVAARLRDLVAFIESIQVE